MLRFALVRRLWLAAIVLVGAANSMAVADIVSTSFVDGALLRFTDSGTPLGAFVPPGTLAQPAGLALGSDGNIYVANQATNKIDKYDAYTGAFNGTFATLSAGYQPAGMRFGSDGNLYVSQFGGAANLATVDKYNGATGAFISSALTGLTQPSGVLFGPGNVLYASALGQGRVVKNVGGVQSDFIAAGSSPLLAPSGMAIGPDGNFYVVDLFGGAVLKYDASGNFLGNFTGTALNGLFPSDVLFDALGNMLVGTLGPDFSSPTGKIEKFNGLTGADLGSFASPIWGASQLLFVPVPEPGTIALTAIGMTFVAFRVRKRAIAKAAA